MSSGSSNPRLADLFTLAGAPLEEIALAIAAEYQAGRRGACPGPARRARFEPRPRHGRRRRARANELIEALAGRAGFKVDGDAHPRSVMLDEVLALRGGHPLALAIVYAAVAARAGFRLYPVGDERLVLLGDPEPQPPLAIDPVPGGRRLPAELRWLCPHLVALRMLDAIGVGYMNRGNLAASIRAAELRLLLPLHPRLREHHLLALRKLRARLN